MKQEQTQKQYWNERAKDYDDLEWVREKEYIKSILDLCDLKKTDEVLDVGTGTGIMMNAVAEKVRSVSGIDISEEMLCKCNYPGNCNVTLGDIRKTYWVDESFDLIIARMVFHHITENTQSAFNECYRLLKPGGRMVISEGIPPNENCKEFFKKVFKVKEKRILMDSNKIMMYLLTREWENVTFKEYTMKRNSVLKWLAKSNLDVRKQIKILFLYHSASDEVKKAYNMEITKGDILIDAKYLNVVCFKQ